MMTHDEAVEAVARALCDRGPEFSDCWRQYEDEARAALASQQEVGRG